MKDVLPVKIEAHEFAAHEFVGGDPALDFLNTITGRDQAPRDWLDSYARLLDWAALVQLLPEWHLQQLRGQAHGDPAAAAAALERAKALREALFAIIGALAARSAPAAAPQLLLNEYWLSGISAHQLAVEQGRLLVRLRKDCTALDLPASMVAYRMIEHVLRSPTERLRICQGPNCSWVFLDTSKAGRRRWCDMAVCGNAAKSRRFHARAQRRRAR